MNLDACDLDRIVKALKLREVILSQVVHTRDEKEELIATNQLLDRVQCELRVESRKW